MLLKDIAFTRSSDKGNHVDISVLAYRQEDYPLLVRSLSEERLKSFFERLSPSRIARYELPNLWAIKIVLYDVLDGGAASNVYADNQGKTWGAALLRLTVLTEEET